MEIWQKPYEIRVPRKISKDMIILGKPSRDKYKLYALWMETWQRPYDTRVPRNKSGIPRVLPPLGREKMHISNIFVPQGRPLSSEPSRNKYKLYVLWMETWQRPYDTRVPRKNSGIPRVLPPLRREKMHISNIFVPQGRPLSSGNRAGINISFMCCGWKHDKDPMIHVSLGRTQESHEFFHPLDERKCI